MEAGSTREVVFTWNDLRLAGTLALPNGSEPYPAVLMLQGSGAADRDSGGFFPPIRDAFLARGIATFSFDKPGIGGSTGDWRSYALSGRADQAAAALAWLRSAAVIDGNRVGVWGHSQGGWLVQMIAAREPNLTFAVSNSGATIGIDEQDRHGWEHSLRARGASEADIAAALAFLESVKEALCRGDDYLTADEHLLRSARAASWYGYLDLECEEDWELERRFSEEAYDPVEALSRVRCPYLAVYGALDPLIPVWESARLCGEALSAAGNPDATVVVFPRGNHRIIVEETGQFAPGYLDLISEWARLKVSGH